MAQAMNLAGGALSAYGNIQQGMNQKKAAFMNADIEEDNAKFAKEAGEDRAKTIMKIGEMHRASANNRASASGLVAATGSPLLIQEEALRESNLDARKARYGARVQALGHKSRAMMYRFSGRNAVAAGFSNASASFMDTAGKAGLMYAGGEKEMFGSEKGVFGGLYGGNT